SVSSVKRCAGASRPCSPNLWSHRFRIHHLRIEPQPQIGLASLCRRTTAARAPGASRAAARTAAETAATEPTAAETAAAETAAAETAAAVHIRRDRRRWLPVRSLAVALDRARQSI